MPSYEKVVKAIRRLPNKGRRNQWLLAMLAQHLDLLSRAASEACALRRKKKLIQQYNEAMNTSEAEFNR